MEDTGIQFAEALCNCCLWDGSEQLLDVIKSKVIPLLQIDRGEENDMKFQSWETAIHKQMETLFQQINTQQTTATKIPWSSQSITYLIQTLLSQSHKLEFHLQFASLSNSSKNELYTIVSTSFYIFGKSN